MNRDKQKEQALKCINILKRTFHLNSEMKKACLNDDILFSLVIKHQDRRWAMSCAVAGHEDFSKIVREFETKYGAFVYHCMINADLLTMLYVGQYEDEWDDLSPVLGENVVYAAVYNTTYHFFEFGYVELDKMSKTLVRIA